MAPKETDFYDADQWKEVIEERAERCENLKKQIDWLEKSSFPEGYYAPEITPQKQEEWDNFKETLKEKRSDLQKDTLKEINQSPTLSPEEKNELAAKAGKDLGLDYYEFQSLNSQVHQEIAKTEQQDKDAPEPEGDMSQEKGADATTEKQEKEPDGPEKEQEQEERPDFSDIHDSIGRDGMDEQDRDTSPEQSLDDRTDQEIDQEHEVDELGRQGQEEQPDFSDIRNSIGMDGFDDQSPDMDNSPDQEGPDNQPEPDMEDDD